MADRFLPIVPNDDLRLEAVPGYFRPRFDEIMKCTDFLEAV
jgi:hypothetical protein